MKDLSNGVFINKVFVDVASMFTDGGSLEADVFLLRVSVEVNSLHPHDVLMLHFRHGSGEVFKLHFFVNCRLVRFSPATLNCT